MGHLAGALNALAGIGTVLVSILIDVRIPLPQEIARPAGMLIVAGGMSLVVWGAAHIRGAFLGEVEPRSDALAQEGPYRFVRHPVYLGMTIALLGVAVATRSWLGVLGALFLFLPSEVYRARLEEKTLARRFGADWARYAAQTGFFLPRLRNR